MNWEVLTPLLLHVGVECQGRGQTITPSPLSWPVSNIESTAVGCLQHFLLATTILHNTGSALPSPLRAPFAHLKFGLSLFHHRGLPSWTKLSSFWGYNKALTLQHTIRWQGPPSSLKWKTMELSKNLHEELGHCYGHPPHPPASEWGPKAPTLGWVSKGSHGGGGLHGAARGSHRHLFPVLGRCSSWQLLPSGLFSVTI